MKELTIKQKAKRYDEALEKARDLYLPSDSALLEEIFPELIKNDDERIKEEIINYLECQSRDEPCRKSIHDKWIAWLKKQKTSEEALQYLKENHSPSEVSDFQTAMNIAVAKAYDKGVKYGLENRGQTFTKKEVDDAYLAGVRDTKKELKKISQRMISAEAKDAMYGKPTAWSEEDEVGLGDAMWAIEQAKTIAKNENDMGNLWYAETWLKSLKERIRG